MLGITNLQGQLLVRGLVTGSIGEVHYFVDPSLFLYNFSLVPTFLGLVEVRLDLHSDLKSHPCALCPLTYLLG